MYSNDTWPSVVPYFALNPIAFKYESMVSKVLTTFEDDGQNWQGIILITDVRNMDSSGKNRINKLLHSMILNFLSYKQHLLKN